MPPRGVALWMTHASLLLRTAVGVAARPAHACRRVRLSAFVTCADPVSDDPCRLTYTLSIK